MPEALMTYIPLSYRKSEPDPVLLKVGDVARMLNISVGTVRSLIDSGDLHAAPVTPSHRLERRHYRITQTSVQAFYQRRFIAPLRESFRSQPLTKFA